MYLFLLTAIYWGQIAPISTHRPTQGINAVIVDRSCLQIEAGYQPILSRGEYSQEAVLQLRYGLFPKGEILVTSGISSQPLRALPVSFAVKRELYSRSKFTLAAAGWAYLPIAQNPSGGQVWFISDLNLWKGGVLTANIVGGYFHSGGQLILPIFLTQSFLSRWSAWVEGFMYVPASVIQAGSGRYGAGAGIQLLLGAYRLLAVDVALNWDSHGAVQTMIGLSHKASLRKREIQGSM
ncbi:MAG: hypothetical protein NZZ60_00260 [Bacteroidia bacterium]|nr:hypothetical protein [Bacteroidia bacterium]MCX7651760.1 hypothetical protein [Bacteroidia bacterium]MDW8416368.1 hypothetical protein [Bacteroidia bacterium]